MTDATMTASTTTAVSTPSTVAVTTAIEPGWRSTELWLKVAAMLLTALYASGVIPTGGPAATVAAIAATMLGALGYTVARSYVKANA